MIPGSTVRRAATSGDEEKGILRTAMRRPCPAAHAGRQRGSLRGKKGACARPYAGSFRTNFRAIDPIFLCRSPVDRALLAVEVRIICKALQLHDAARQQVSGLCGRWQRGRRPQNPQSNAR